MTHDWQNYKLTGCIFETNPKPAPTLSTPSIQLPDRVDLRVHCSPVENQLQTNSCVANAVVGALEFHQKKAGLPLTDLSRLYVYYNARALAGAEMQDGGSLIHHGMAAVLAHGACEARMWPFQEAMVTTRPTEACYKDAMRNEAVQFARTPVGVPALTALSQGLPVVFGMYAPSEYYQIAAQTGVMPKPSEVVTTQPPSGHAMLIVGYDMTEQTYLVRNSWSAAWADQGYCRIPFETLEAWGPSDAFWTIGAIEQTSGFSLSGPSMLESMSSFGITTETLAAGPSSLGQLRTDLRASLTSELESAKRDFKDRLRGK